jgi:hypothetical protein
MRHWGVGLQTEVHTRFWWTDFVARDHLECIGIEGRIILKRIFKKWDGEAWTKFLWLKIGTGGRHL